MLGSLALILLCGLLVGEIFRRCKMPALIGMLAVGIVLGPYVLDVLDGSVLAVSAELRRVALIVILARAGLALDVEDLRQIGRPAVLMSFVPACFEMCGTMLMAQWLLGLPLLDAAILGAVVASASPAVIVPRMLKLMEEGYGTAKRIPQLVLAGDSVDDVFNIVVFSALVGLAKGENVSAVRFAEVPVAIVTGVLAGAAVGFLLAALFRRMQMRGVVEVIVLLGVAFLMVAAEDRLEGIIPFSGLLAVMAAGVVILKRGPLAAKRMSGTLAKLWTGAEVLLFVLVGASVDIGYASEAGLKTVLMLAVVLVIRAIGIQLCLLGTKLNGKERLFCALTGIPKATVQAAIGGIPLAMGLPNGGMILAVAVMAILVTAPVGALLLDGLYERLLQKSEEAI